MTPQQENEMLLPCAHCGCQATFLRRAVVCDVCLSEVLRAHGESDEALIAAWNRRAPAPTEPAVDQDAAMILDALEDARQFAKNNLVAVSKIDAAKNAVARAVIMRIATPASPAVPEPAPLAPKKYKLTVADKAALAEAARTGATAAELPGGAIMFINRGADYQDDGDLNCPHCGGSGHKDDVRPAPQVAQASQPTSAEGKDSERLDETNVALPTLKPGQSWCCGGCGSGVVKNPKRIDFEYSREEMPDGRVISKTTPQYVAPCCGGELILWNDEIDDSEAWQYVAIAERASTGKDSERLEGGAL